MNLLFFFVGAGYEKENAAKWKLLLILVVGRDRNCIENVSGEELQSLFVVSTVKTRVGVSFQMIF